MSKEEQVEKILQTPSLEMSLTNVLEGSFFEKGDWPSKTWWEEYGVKELNGLIEKALKENPTIQAVKERIAFAKNKAVIAGSELYPLIYFNGNDEWQRLSKNGLYRAFNPNLNINANLVNFNFSYSYELDFWGKYHNLYYAALGKEKAAIAETAQAELIISTALATAYFALRTNLIRKELYEKLYLVRLEYYQLQEKMRKSALYGKLTPLFSEEAVFEAEKWLYSIEQEVAMNQHLVNILVGQGPDIPLLLNEPLSPLAKKLSTPTNISAELLIRRPDLMAQTWRMDALAHEVGAAKANFWPNFNLVGLLGLESLPWSRLFQWASSTFDILPAFTLPVYTAGAIGANVDVKKAEFYEAVYSYNDLILKSFQEVADLLAVGRSVFGEKEKQEQIVEVADERYQLYFLREEKGLDNALTTYTAIEELLQKKLENIVLLFQQYMVSISLTRSLGGGYLHE